MRHPCPNPGISRHLKVAASSHPIFRFSSQRGGQDLTVATPCRRPIKPQTVPPRNPERSTSVSGPHTWNEPISCPSQPDLAVSATAGRPTRPFRRGSARRVGPARRSRRSAPSSVDRSAVAGDRPGRSREGRRSGPRRWASRRPARCLRSRLGRPLGASGAAQRGRAWRRGGDPVDDLGEQLDGSVRVRGTGDAVSGRAGLQLLAALGRSAIA